MMARRQAFLPISTALLYALAARAGESAPGTRVDVKPGPTTISAEEAAIQADPARGIEHGVILVEETSLDEAHGSSSRLDFHRRAKILSGEGRDLATVGIVLEPEATLDDWWARTLLPDGRTLAVEDKDVVFQTVIQDGFWKVRVAKLALRGVVPGAVIDYGYTLTRESVYRWHEVALQGPWPIRRLAYRWRPHDGMTSAYRIRGAEGLDVRVENGDAAVLVEGRNLTPAPREPFMPLQDESQATAIFYYLRRGEKYDDFWDDSAKGIEKELRTPPDEALIRRLSSVTERAGPDPVARLKVAYDWIAENVQNSLFARADDGERLRLPVPTGALDAMDKLILDFARVLGLDAHAVLTPNRSRQSWDPLAKTLDQLPASVVAVRPPGASDDRLLFVHVRSGLPFGDVPWWNSGVQAMLATSDGAKPVLVRAAGAAGNTSRVRGQLSVADDGATWIAHWDRTAAGQYALADTQGLGGLADKERKERIATLCGLGPDVEVARSDWSVTYPPVSSRLACESRRRADAPDAAVGIYTIDWSGPWIGSVPDLPPGPRVHPVVFDFPRVDTMELTVKAPSGFRPRAAPEPRQLSGPYGKYRLVIAATPEGYEVNRALALLPLRVPPAEYEALRSFVEEVRRADRTPLTFVRAESPR